MSLAKNIGKSLSNKYGQGLLDSTKRSTTDAIKTASKRVATELHSKKSNNNNNNNNNYEDVEIEDPKKRYITPEERKEIIEELRLVPKKYV